MRTSTLAFGTAFVLCGSALAQDSAVEGSASSQSNTSVSASRDGATAQQEGGAAAEVHSANADASAAQGGEINATLTKPVDARRAKSGDEVTATLAQDLQGGGDVTLHRGTKLVGHVTEAQPRGRRSESGAAGGTGSAESRLGIAFDKAILQDGREVPFNATIQAVASTEAAAPGNARSLEGAAGGNVSGGTFGTGRAVGGGTVGGVGSVGSSVGGALGGAASVGSALGGRATAPIGSATRASAGAVGGLGADGRLLSGSRGVFGMGGVDLASAAAGSAQGSSVLTSRTGNVDLPRGTQMILVGQAAGSARGASTTR